MLEFFKIFHLKNPHAIFLFVTNEASETILDQAKNLGLKADNFRIVSAKHDEVPLYISIFSWAIFFIRPSFSKKASSPIKQGEIMAMGIPILTNTGIGDTDVILNDHQAGIIIENFEMETLDNIDLIHFKVDSTNIRSGSLSIFDLSFGIEKYAEIYERL